VPSEAMMSTLRPAGGAAAAADDETISRSISGFMRRYYACRETVGFLAAGGHNPSLEILSDMPQQRASLRSERGSRIYA
jgi:hypothetical protein